MRRLRGAPIAFRQEFQYSFKKATRPPLKGGAGIPHLGPFRLPQASSFLSDTHEKTDELATWRDATRNTQVSKCGLRFRALSIPQLPSRLRARH